MKDVLRQYYTKKSNQKKETELGLPRAEAHDYLTLHYALAAEVQAIRDRQQEFKETLTQVSVEARTPKPFAWGAIASITGAVLAAALTIGGLIQQNISTRIDDNQKHVFEIQTTLSSHTTELSEVSKERDIRLRESIQELDKRSSSRIDDVNNKLVELYTIKSEFKATIDSIHERQLRNEKFIEQNREDILKQSPSLLDAIKAQNEALNRRIDKLYSLYELLQNESSKKKRIDIT